MVQSRLKGIGFPEDRVVIHQGFIEKILLTDHRLPSKVSFAYLYFDFYEPIKLTLQFLNDVMSIGAVLIVDDYDFFSTGAKMAVDEWLEESNLHNTRYECFIPNNRYGYFAVITKKG